MFSNTSRAIIYGKHLDVAERMLDFDSLSNRSPSVAGIIDPNAHKVSQVKIFFWPKEILVPIYPSFREIPEDDTIDTFLNFASFRSAADATRQALESRLFKNIVIIAEWIPERDIREIIAYNDTHDRVRIIGPATAGAIAAGTLRMGNSGGSLDNIVASRLYRRGSIGFVSRSGGMSNEMFRVISRETDGIHTGIALWGDRFVCSTFEDIVTAYAENPEIEMIVLLGEVWSRDELAVADMLRNGKIQKPVVAYVTGSLAEKLSTEVQFWHAGAKANASEETASHKNRALKEAGAFVPESYRDFGSLIGEVYRKHIGKTVVPTDTEAAWIEQKLAMLQERKKTIFTSTISDERSEDLLLNGTPVAAFVEQGSIARVLGALWLKRDLPEYALDFINTIIILLADHGPAVSGATNTIITARAGKDLVSSLIAGLLTIGPRFGGAIDGAARYFFEAVRTNESPEDFVARMKKSGIPIPGIGHRVKSKFNPDGRTVILREKSSAVPWSKYLEYALAVEELTLEKKPNLILNVDGHIAVILLDIFESIGMDEREIASYIEAGLFNAFFVLARSIGFIGHALDQKRLSEPLYRTPWEHIHYGE